MNQPVNPASSDRALDVSMGVDPADRSSATAGLEQPLLVNEQNHAATLRMLQAIAELPTK